MAHVHFSAGLRSSFTGGVTDLVIDAPNVRALIRALDERFPGIGDKLSSGTSVAIDGEIIPDADLESLEAASEVHFLETIAGG
jgi:sulfur-carrier protein